MKNCFSTVISFLFLLVATTNYAQATSPSSTDQSSLLYVTLVTSDDLNRFVSTQLPLYAMVNSGLLTGADLAGQQALSNAGLSFQVLAADLSSDSYYLSEPGPNRSTLDYSAYGQVLLNLGDSVLLRIKPSKVDSLAQAGAELRAVTLTPKPLPATESEGVFLERVTSDPIIQTMIDRVSTTQVYTYVRQLSGELPVWVDGDWYTIPSRNTYSGTPIQNTTSFVGQHMSNDLDLGVEYYQWNNATNPDVIGEIPGLVHPDDIFIIGAHIDDVNGTPGADDNASGSVATLIAADILSQYLWNCTLRFAFWAGEEQGLLGSASYAHHSHDLDENIVGYLNLDMIAYNTPNSPPGIYLGYNPSMPSTLELANLFAGVVDAYNINLLPVIGTNYGGRSDHSTFWDYGYTAILGIEGDNDFNPYYHQARDTSSNTNPSYFTDYIKASIATYAHMSGCLIRTGYGSLDGHLTSTIGGAPISGAVVISNDGLGHSSRTTSDLNGYFKRPLMANTYTVTVEAYGYYPFTMNGVVVTTDAVTTQDFTLVALPTYSISGHFYDAISGVPLQGTVQITDAPFLPVKTDQNGFYNLTVAEGIWNLRVKALLYNQQTQEVVVNNDLTVNFYLEPLDYIFLPFITKQ